MEACNRPMNPREKGQEVGGGWEETNQRTYMHNTCIDNSAVKEGARSGWRGLGGNGIFVILSTIKMNFKIFMHIYSG